MKINVLGTDYEIVELTVEQDERLDKMDGYCDPSVKKCVIDKHEVQDKYSKQDLVEYKRQVTRHELVHAFLFESGLSACSWAENEELVDWIALQAPKMFKAFKDANAL